MEQIRAFADEYLMYFQLIDIWDVIEIIVLSVIVYYMMIGLLFVVLMVFSRLAVGNGAAIRLPGWLLPCAVPAGILLYALSWLLSVAIYKRREV